MTAPEPGSPEWLRLVTASKVAAILGVSPWESPRSLWHRMRGELPREEGNKNTRRGQYLEAGVLAWWMDQHPEITDRTDQCYSTLPETPWAAATLDSLVTDAHGNTIVVEVKTAARADEWGTPGTDEIPTYYAAQVQWQLAMVPEAQFACVAVLLGPGLDLVEYVVERDDDLIAALIIRCKAFYDSLSGKCPPDLDDTVATFEAIRAMHPDIDGTDLEISDDIAREYVESKAAEEAAEARARLAKTVLLDVMGNARRALVDATPIARRQPFKGGVALHQIAKTLTPKEAA